MGCENLLQGRCLVSPYHRTRVEYPLPERLNAAIAAVKEIDISRGRGVFAREMCLDADPAWRSIRNWRSPQIRPAPAGVDDRVGRNSVFLETNATAIDLLHSHVLTRINSQY